MAMFLLKTEPGEFSIDDLERESKKKPVRWDGITNAAALKALREARRGDEAFVYHTGDERAIVGLARITTDAYADPKNPGLTAAGETKTPVVDLVFVKRAPTPVTLEAIKADKRFAAFALVKQSRLSAMMVPPELEKVLRKLAGV
jgi:predicted RNA-binding protein with PUA-like domain